MRRPAALLACAAILSVAGLSALPVADAAARPRGRPVAREIAPSQFSVRAADRYWTPARMRRAVARSRVPTRVRSTAGASSAGRGGAQAPRRGFGAARPFFVPPSHPAGRGAALSASSVEVPDPTAYPLSTNGRAFFRGVEFDFSCSATVVSAPNASVVITAGHCVNSGGAGGHWYSHWVFVPGYHDGQKPFGAFVAKELDTTPGWIGSANDNFDVAAVVLSRNEAGRRVQRVAGGRGLATGIGRDQVFDAFGYPAGAPFNGQSLQTCRSPYLGNDPASRIFAGPPTMKIDCDMTDGSSGGGWVNQAGALNGIISYGYSGQPDLLYGPYFGGAVRRLYAEVRSVR